MPTNRVVFILALLALAALPLSAQIPPPATEEAPEDEEGTDVVEAAPASAAPDGILPVSEVFRIEYGPSDRPRLLLHGRTLILVTQTGSVEARDSASGEFRWKLGLPGEVLFPPVLYRADPFEVLISSPSGKVLVVDGRSGAIRREMSVGFELALPPHPDGARLLLGTVDGTVVAVDVESFSERFRAQTGEAPLAYATGAGLLVVSGSERTLTALDAETGAVRWTLRARAPFAAPAVFRDAMDRLYVGDDAGEFYCLSADKGKVRFRWSTGAAIRSPALVLDKRVYVTSFGNVLYTFDAGGGAEQWRVNLPGRPASGPVLVGKRILVATFDGTIVEVNFERGQIGKTYTAPGELASPPSIWVEPQATAPSVSPDAPSPPLGAEPPWFQSHRVGLALRSGAALLLGHTAPEPAPEIPDAEDAPEGPPPPKKPVPPLGWDSAVLQRGWSFPCFPVRSRHSIWNETCTVRFDTDE